MKVVVGFTCLLGILLFGRLANAQSGVPSFGIERQLLAEPPESIVAAARKLGDPIRGAIAFYQPYASCTKCHAAGDNDKPLGPDLAKGNKELKPVQIVESILHPSKVIKKGFDTVTITTLKGKSVSGLFVEDRDDAIVYRSLELSGKTITLPKSQVDEFVRSKQSIMPKGLVNQLSSRQQFLDLVRYLIEITEQGPQRALQLRPNPSLFAARPLPAYEQHIDHAGMIRGLDAAAFKRGEAIYNRLCINCHGTKDRPGSLPTSLRFATGKFKNGADPHTMYQTLTRGFGMMVPQTWMVPQQKYDVIHFIRQAYLKPHNPSQLFAITDAYTAGLPKGDTRGPAPRNDQPWILMDYGPSLIASYELPGPDLNFAYKGVAMRLDPGPGGVSRGRRWMIFDHDTLRMSAAWSGQGFIDWNGIMLNGRHGIHPRLIGDVLAANPVGPGWANPETGGFEDPRMRGRDNRLYGPLPRKWAHLKGIYNHGPRTIVSYSVGKTTVLESPGLAGLETHAVMTRTFNIGPRDRDMTLQVATIGQSNSALHELRIDDKLGSAVAFGISDAPKKTEPASTQAFRFNGATRVEIANGDDFDMHAKDFSITARIRTRKDGTIFAKTKKNGPWVPDGKSLFIRGGRLVFDIGWVGAVQSKKKVTDGKPHDVVMTWTAKSGAIRIYVDGKLDGSGSLKPKAAKKGFVVRIGYTSANFPGSNSFFNGEISQVAFLQRALSDAEIAKPKSRINEDHARAIAIWNFEQAKGDAITSTAGKKHVGKVIQGAAPPSRESTAGSLVAGFTGAAVRWLRSKNGKSLRLRIPAGEQPVRGTLWLAKAATLADANAITASLDTTHFGEDLSPLTKGGPKRWNAPIKTLARVAQDSEPFAVDVLTRPSANPWNARVRLTGFDFYPDGDRMAASTWDGDVWLVSGLSQLPESVSGEAKPVELTWQRIATGLFQPLGVKLVAGKLYVSCRDQIAVLHDYNGDEEIDYIENFNNDHQVTEHFHEFAMGLQTDRDGNFYYAKSARHALTALVPHHGTLLRVSKDGSKTQILAKGFRAANGVCLNPDGSFIVTDQEGHWNPKNRINWVKEGGFYGNMFGYHDVTDSSDSAMEQPLCWITNAFDRSPAELLWVDSKKWGPLNGSLLNFSYGYGKVYIVPHERVDGQIQGGMCEFPMAQFPTGVMRGRFRPHDGQLFTCGMFAWAGSQHQPGGLYRIRYTGKPVQLPVGLKATTRGMEITFSGALDPASVTSADKFAVKTWSLKRTAGYGSKHYNERPAKVTGVKLSADGRTIFLDIEDMQPTWCMEIAYSLRAADGKAVNGRIHNTVHKLGK